MAGNGHNYKMIKRPVISYVPNTNDADHVYCFVNKTETAYDLTPVLAEYHRRYGSPEKVVRMDGHDFFRPASPVRYHVEEKQHFVRPVISPDRDHPRPREVKEFLVNVQNIEALKPDRSYHTNPSYLHHTPNSYQVDTTGDLPYKDWNKLKNDASDDYYKEPPPPPPPPNAFLSKPTNDIHAAMELIRQAAKVSGPDSKTSRYKAEDTDAAMGLMRQAAKVSGPDSKNSRYAVPSSTASRAKGKNEITDGREAQKRYGNPNLLSREKEAYSGIIDSKMAAKKYGGALV